MGQGPCVLRELFRLQVANLGNPLDRAGALVGGEFVVAIDGQAFLEAQLEPITTRDAVAGPVVEIFMRDDRLDIGVIGIGRGLGMGKDVLVVEDVQPLVLSVSTTVCRVSSRVDELQTQTVFRVRILC